MRRRSGFTLVEVLVAMALILFIMTILGAAFSAATQTVSDLKSAGDLAERLRGAATVIHRDLEANHCFDANGNVLRLSTMWNTNFNPTPPPPAQGFVRIYEQLPGQPEGTDVNGLPSYYQTTASLAYTICLTGTRRDDFLSAFVPGSPLLTDPTLGPPDQRYQDSPNVYNSPSAEVALFLVPTNDVTDASGTGPKPLFSLCRRQLLTTPPTQPVGQFQPHWSPAATVAGPNPNYVEVSTVPTAGEAAGPTNLSFNSLADLTMPVKRFWMNRGNLAGVYQPAPPPPGAANTLRYATMGECNAGYQAADLLMPDVVSMDVRVLIAGDSDFRDLFDQQVQQYGNGNPSFPAGGPRVFDTWSSAADPVNAAYNYSNWQAPGQTTSIPLYKNANGVPISIKAIQITLRVWDFKTKKTRQVTIVQQM